MPEPNFRNRALYHGDNLDFLQGMNSGTVHLIAPAPPFNKFRDFHAPPDSLAAGARFKDCWSWDKDVHPEWVDSIKDERPAVWSVIKAARVASATTAPSTSLSTRQPTPYAKGLLDAIFGKQNYGNYIPK